MLLSYCQCKDSQPVGHNPNSIASKSVWGGGCNHLGISECCCRGGVGGVAETWI